MRTRFTSHCLLACAVLGVFWNLSGLARGAGAPARPVIVVVAGHGAGLTDLSLGMLRRAYDGDPTRAAGIRLIPFNYPPDNLLRQRFDWRVLELRPAETGRYWIDRRIRGEGYPPRTVPSAEVLKAVVARLPGAIGYLSLEQLDSSVRALTIDGRSHTDPEYPLVYGPGPDGP